MKKRILALALAGTTAFSVFGAALSANAAYVYDKNTNSWVWEDDSSTHVAFQNDEYVPYFQVVKEIDSTPAESATSTELIDHYIDPNNKNKDITFTDTNKNGKYDTEELLTGIDKYIQDEKIYFAEDYTALYQIQDAGTWYLYADLSAVVKDTRVIKTEDLTDEQIKTIFGVTTVVDNSVTKYVYNGNSYTKAELFTKVAEARKNTLYYVVIGKGVNKSPTDYAKVLTEKAYKDAFKVVYKTDSTPAKDGNITVTDINNAKSEYNNWYFDASTTVSDTDISLIRIQTGDFDGNGTIETRTVYVPTVFAYDFVYANQLTNTAGAIGSVWNDTTKNENAVSVVLGDKVYTAERGDGSTTYGVRAGVVSDWVDFLDELGINHDNGYRETLDEFLENYYDMYENVAVYDPNTGKLLDYNKVDLYNLDELLRDIYALSAKNYEMDGNNYGQGVLIRGWSNANTSEMVYLMQQYDKYFNDYVQKEEVATGEWGEFLLEILNSATADDFAKSVDYTRYVNRVENLEAAYESATTVNMIREAEEGMYALLTELNGSYKAAATPSKTDLAATMESLYFNIKTPGLTYTTAPSTQSANVDYKTYNYYVAVAKKQNTGNEWTFTSTLAPGYYSLYPMADYIDDDTTTPNEVYAGNKSAVDYTGTPKDKNYATEEYEWFWNVYQLAYNMNKSNTKQGSIDAIDAALNEAVAALAPTTSPYATETTAMEEMMDEYTGKIDTDYNEGFYDKYEQAYDYAENSAEGKYQTRIARYIVGVAGEALTYQGTQLTVTKQMITTLEASIKEGKTALEAIKADANYNAAQVNALNKALAEAQNILDLYNGTAFNKHYGDQRDGQSVNHVYTSKVGDKDQYVISDVDNAIAGIDAAINYSEIVMGWSQNDAGKWMYGTEEGYLNDGWHQVDGGKTWFYFNADGTAKQSEWWNDNGTWYWFNSNCGAATGWAKVDGEWYFFKGNNAMKTGWEKVDGNWYYMASSGKMVTGWCEVNGKWYYFSKESNSLGQMLYSTTVDGYKLGADGAWIK